MICKLSIIFIVGATHINMQNNGIHSRIHSVATPGTGRFCDSGYRLRRCNGYCVLLIQVDLLRNGKMDHILEDMRCGCCGFLH